MNNQALCFPCAMGVSKDEHDCQRSIELALDCHEFLKSMDNAIDEWLSDKKDK